MVERKTLNLVVVGSIPTGGAFWHKAAKGLQSVPAGHRSMSSRFSSVGRASD